MSLYDTVKYASETVDGIEYADGRVCDNVEYRARTPYSILASATSELGELAQEVMINQHHSYKQPGTDGIIGEAIDVIACLLDLIHKVDPSITEKELERIAATKCIKWATLVRRGKGLY